MVITIGKIRNELIKMGYDIQIEGDQNVEINDFCSLNYPKDNAISWVRYAQDGVLSDFKNNNQNIVVATEYIKNDIGRCGFIICNNPKEIFFVILKIFFESEEERHISNKSTVLTSNIGDNVSIGDFCYIGEKVTIGHNVIIDDYVSIRNKAVIGDNSIIHSGVVIGTDGFGYYFDDNNVPYKVSHFGGVRIGKNVEIGANTCIDRGTIDDTVIGDNSKIDNLCHIAHNVVMGDNVVVIAGSIVCGSAQLGDDVYVAPGAIIMNTKKVAEKSLIGMGSVVMNDTHENKVYIGTPAQEKRDRKKEDTL